MKKIKSLIIAMMFLISLLIVINPVSAADINVPGDYSTIQAAINSASSGDTIYFHAGTYNEHLSITKNLTLIGDGASVTTINDSSGGTSDVINVNGAVVNINGFTVRNGKYGIYYQNNASGTITNNTMTGNVYTGIFCEFNSSPTIMNNTITNNGSSVTLPGGILNYHNSSPVIAGNTIANNTGDGIMNLDNSNPAIYNNTISGNTTNGIYNNYDPLMPGGTGSSPIVTNNTIVGNFIDGIRSRNGSNPTITNNIIVLNVQYGIYDDGTGAPVCTYNDVWGNTPDYTSVIPGVGSISKDPKLDATYHLTSSSPCIDAGTGRCLYRF